MAKMIHSLWAWAVLILVIIALVNAIRGMSAGREFTARDRKLSLLGLIAAHVQFLLGLGAYFSSHAYQVMKDQGMKVVMGDAQLRNMAMEHPVAMLLGIILITIGYSRHKRKSGKAAFASIAAFYGVGLLLILAKIPWGDWL